ncbi:MAG: hypothetical protein E7439_05370 [Ruminococcaceae bacterium]|nr:hypothetical protein [Oscillospiraceae bacterium]
MKTLQNNQKKNGGYLPLAFLFPVACMLIYMYFGQCCPFGEYSMLYSDNYHQYYPFFKAFRKNLLSGDSLLYSWDVGMGLDYLGLFSYYLSSPLNLLSVFVPEGLTLEFFSLLVPVKMGLASLFFAIFLKKTFGKDDISLPLFGTFYGMCAWAMGYQWNLMWLDSFALLPLVALGTISLLRDKKFVLYTVTLFLSIYANYYIGFFVCIFVLLLFFCYQICRGTSVKRMFLDLCRIAAFSLLAIGMTAVLSLPALAALQTTQSSVNTYPEGFAVNIITGTAVGDARNAWLAYEGAKESGGNFAHVAGLWLDAVFASIPPLWDGMAQVAGNLAGGIEPTFKEGLPNLYCGVGTVVLAFLFLTTKRVKLSDKICSVGLLVFFILSFLLRQLDYIWHGFHFTNMIPYRFSFLFSFVMLYMAYRAYLLRRHMQLWQILVAAALTILILGREEIRTNPTASVYNGVFMLLYLACLIAYKLDFKIPANSTKTALQRRCRIRRIRRTAVTCVMAGVMAVELIVNMVNFATFFPRTNVVNYPKGTESAESAVAYMKYHESLRDDELFYRAEVTHSQTLNDGALNGYHGVSTFTSSANVKVTEFMKALGYGAKNTYNRYCFEEASPVSNLFLNLKYMLERDGDVEENPYFEDVHNFGQVHILQNTAYLPLGFLAEPELGDISFEEEDSSFAFQNALFSAATGLDEDVWNVMPYEWLTVIPKNMELQSQTPAGYCSYKVGGSTGTLVFKYEIMESGFMCLDLLMNGRNTYNVYRNGEHLYTESISLPQTIAVSQVEPGDVVEVRVTCNTNTSNSVTVKAVLMDDEVFRKGYEILSASTLKLTEFSNTKVAGTVKCNRDGLLYTSIPQNGTNWQVYVDGQQVEPVLVGDVMMAVNLTEGEHEIRFVYENRAFEIGLTVSLICLAIFLAIILVVNYPKYKPVIEKVIAKIKK